MFYRNQPRNNSLGVGILAFMAGALAWSVLGKPVREELDENDDFKNLKKLVTKKVLKISDLTQEKYDQIVDEVTDKYGRARDISQNELQDLADDLKVHWNRIKRAWNEGGDNA